MFSGMNVSAVNEPWIVAVIGFTVGAGVVMTFPYGFREGNIFWPPLDAHVMLP
jgi:hypothetical protein